MVNTVHKSIQILSLLARSGDMGVTEVSRALGLPKSSVHNILQTLAQQRLVERRGESNRFHLGIRLIELGNRAQLEVDLCRLARPFLRSLNERTDETVHLTVLDSDEVLYVDCVESRKRLRTYSVIGVRAPLYCTSVGKAILAFQPGAEIQRILDGYPMTAFTENTITDRDRLLEELRVIRRHGYSVDDMEHEEHIRCVGAPIFEPSGKVNASLSVSGPAERVLLSAVPQLAAQVVAVAGAISAKLGYRGSAAPTASGFPAGAD